MVSRPVPVTLGSPRFSTAAVDGCAVVHAWFPPNSELEPHTHARPTVAIMLNGSFDLRFSGREFACHPGCISVEPAGERHANRMHRAGAEVLVLQPDPHSAQWWEPFAGLLGAIGWQRHGPIASLAARVAREVRSPDAFSPLMIEALVLEILVTASRLADKAHARGRAPWLLRAQEVLHAHPTRCVTVGQLAAECGVPPAQLARGFRQRFLTSIGAYARGLRLDWAARQLAETSAPIATIAAQGGFSDQSHLTRLLKRHTGLTPYEFRKRATDRR